MPYWVGVFALLLISQNAYGAKDRLINGAVAEKKDWPASVQTSNCSATVIGEKTLLIASHCVGDGKKASFSAAGTSYTGVCTHAPGYPANKTADWTLCLIDKTVTDIKYESLNSDPNRFKIGDKLTLTGYGCTITGGGGTDGKFRFGEATIKTLPTGTNYDITTKGGSALCYGDSGGAAYYVDKSSGQRWVVGVNSRGDIKTTSFLPSLATTTAKDFISKWSKNNGQSICGIHPDAMNCRDEQCDPKPYVVTGPDATIKKGESVFLGTFSISGQSYSWTPTTGLDDPNVAMPLASPQSTITYTLAVTNECGKAEGKVKVTVN